MTAFDRHGIGGNNPPAIPELLKASYEELNKQIELAMASAARAPTVIEDDTVLGKFGDLTKHLGALRTKADEARESEKKPFLAAGREVDDFFRPLIGAIDAVKPLLLNRVTNYLADKEAKRRAEAEQAAKTAQEEADARLRDAERAQDNGDTDKAMVHLAAAEVAETQAVEAHAVAEAKPAALARTYSTGGSVSTLKKEWKFAIEDRDALIKMPDATALPPAIAIIFPYLAAADLEKAIRAYVKAGGRKLAGVKIYEAPKASIR